MKLDVYRSCSPSEKREVLGAFWHKDVNSSARVREAAVQYGPWAVLSLVAIAVELAIVMAVALGHADVIVGAALVIELFVLWSLWWALVRSRHIRREASSAPQLRP